MDNIKQLIELNIEIEGLLRVAEYRRSDTVETLLLSKSKKFLDLLSASLSDERAPQDAYIVIPPIPARKETDTTNEIEDEVVSPTLEDDSSTDLKESYDTDEINIMPGEKLNVVSDDIETVLEMELPEHELQEFTISGDQLPPVFNPAASQKDSDEDIPVNNPDEIQVSKDSPYESDHVMRLDEMIHRQSSRDLKRAFSLNDRFRYIREIFDNDANYFDETIRNLEMLSNLDEVYDYLLGDIGLDHEDETVKDFLAIIYNHFNA